MTDPAELARTLDREDALASFRQRFFLPPGRDGEPAIYFAGHSLGPQPFSVRDRMEAVLDDWAELGVKAWFDPSAGWTDVDRRFAELAAPILGAIASEVCVSGSLTGNLHAVLTSFYRPVGRRHAILVEGRPFPSDRYAVASHVRRHGFDPASALIEAKAAEIPGETTQDGLLATLEREKDRIAMVLVGAVNWYSGEAFDLAEIVAAAHAHGIPVVADLAHAAGNVPLALHDAGVDAAVWCGYKYLNGGPGAPAGLFVHERHHGRTDLDRLAGWWGHRLDTRFVMPDTFDPEPGAAGWQVSTPSILALAPLGAALALVHEAGLEALHAKSVRLTGFLERLLDERLPGRVEIVTPRDPARRGAQLSLRAGSRAVHERLARQDVVCDWREPDVMRVAPAPLYSSFAEVAAFVDRLSAALDG